MASASGLRRLHASVLVGLVAVVVLTLASPGSAAVGADGSDTHALPAVSQRPDIVVLLLDDLPQMDRRLWKRLPTIRRLFLRHGVEFTDSVGNDPLCCPGRANLLTGQWSHHHGVVSNDARLFDPRVSIATELHELGYWTGIFGKYFNRTPSIADRTPDGWDRSFLIGGAYYRYLALVDGVAQRFGSEPGDHSTLQIEQRAISALQAIHKPQQPRFLWLAPFAIHGGRDELGQSSQGGVPLPSDRGSPACADIPPWDTPAFHEQNMSDKPAYLQDRPLLPPRSLVASCESLLSVDRMLARVLAELAAQGRPEPLVILTADNGMTWGAHRWGSKSVPYATPVPLLIHWPSGLGTKPATIRTTISNVDLAPTLCEIAGCVMGPFPNGHGVDGLSFLSVLRAKGGRLGREVVFEEHNTNVDQPTMVPWTGIRTTNEAAIGRWVYTEYETGEKELYHITGGPCVTWTHGDRGDPCELNNLAGRPAHAEVQARLAATLAARERNPMRVRRAP